MGMRSPLWRHAAMKALCLGALLALATESVLTQGDPPWKRSGSAFLDNPAGYARDLHRRYAANRDELARLQAYLPTLRRERTGAETTGIGFFDALRELGDLAKLRQQTEAQIEYGERVRAELEREWAQWCEMGLLGSPMPPLSAANESIEDVYLDTSTTPPVRRTRAVDRIDFNIRYFLEEKAAQKPPASGGPGSGTFTQDPFNGLQITYSISGASLGKSEDGGPFEGWVRTYTGILQGGTLRVSGTVTKGPGSNPEFPGHATISVWAGDKKAEKTILLDKGKAESFDASVDVPPGAPAGGVSVHLWGDYRNGEMRFVRVAADLSGTGAGSSGRPAVRPPLPEPQPPSRPTLLGWGVLSPGHPLRLVPAGRQEAEEAHITATVPMGWVAGDVLITGAEGPSSFVFPEYLRGVIGAGSRLELAQNGAKLARGSAICEVLKQAWSFTLSTPAATIRAEGSVFATQVLQDGTTIVAVGSGTADVTTSTGKSPVAVRAGSWTRIVPGQQPTTSEALTADRAQQLFGGMRLWRPAAWTGPPPLAGDADGNGILEQADALLALRMSKGLVPVNLICDVDRDGQVTEADARLILQAIVKK